MKLGLMSAVVEEDEGLTACMSSDPIVVEKGRRQYRCGKIEGVEVVLVRSGWGKVAAATTATQLIEGFSVDAILFTGVAGGIAADLPVGDVVVAEKLMQHDLDCRPFYSPYVVPQHEIAEFVTDPELTDLLRHTVKESVANIRANRADLLLEFGIESPSYRSGLIASGDTFFASADQVEDLRKRIPATQCVEMEGASVAQVCYEHDIPCAVVRTVSDRADAHAEMDFPKFMDKIARYYTVDIVRGLCRALTDGRKSN